MEIINTPINRKEIITLILADMRNRRLLLGLEQAGLHSDNFYTNLTDLILQKMGFEHYENEAVCLWYEETIFKLIDTEMAYFTNHERQLAARLYELLIVKRHTMQEIENLTFRFQRWVKMLLRR